MISRTLRVEESDFEEETVLRVSLVPSANDAEVFPHPSGSRLQHASGSAVLQGISPEELAGDVLLLQPRLRRADRLVRASSRHNSFLVTERCDQLCIMCSQPPKKTHFDMFRHFSAAAQLAPPHATITVTGGEPTLYKRELFDFFREVLAPRPDLRFQVLSNAQHFTEDDISFLRSDIGRKVRWGVPLYSVDSDTHDDLVGKAGAFDALLDGLAILGRSAAQVELRTVVMKPNVSDLVDLARFITAHVPFARPWAIMQLENIGFAKKRWGELFHDHSEDFACIAAAMDIARLAGVPVTLFNFPLCTVPPAYRRFAPATISDWKRRFEPTCETCIAKPFCGGFFEWHPRDASYRQLGLT